VYVQWERMQMRVFLSSTFIDLVAYRKVANEALQRLDTQVDRMEVLGARPQEPNQVCLEEIERSDLFVGIYAHRYGFIPRGSALSITEQEYDRARQLAKPIFCFVVDEDFPWPPPMIEDEPGRSKLRAFKAKVGTDLVQDVFTTPEDLATKVATAVGRYLTKPSVPATRAVPSTEDLHSFLAALELKARAGDEEAIAELSLSGDPRAFDVLASLLENSPQEKIRESVANAFANLSDPRRIPLLGNTLVSEKWMVAAACAQTLGRSKDPAAVPYLLRALQLNVDWLVTQKSAEALGFFPATEATTKALIKTLNRGSFEGQAAKQSLVRQGSDAVSALIENLDHATSFEGLAFTMQALAIIGDQRAIPALEATQRKIETTDSPAKTQLQCEVSVALDSLK
jgi:hypothetical protein